MDLATLKFVVDTKELEDAATKVAELGAAVSKLNKPMQDLSSNTNKVSTATEKASKATENKAKADEKAVTATSKLDGLLDKLTNRYTDMAKGSTSAEAGVLQLARSLGATTESALKPYKDILESIRELSKSPFDSAIGSVRSITQEYDSLTYRSELAAKGIFLTTTQLKEYSRIANEIKGKLKAADLDPTQGEGLAKFNSELKTQQELYLGIANKVNTLKTAEKERNDLLSSQMKESIRLQEASDNLFKYNLLRHKEEQQGYQQDMLEMKKYYSTMEKYASSTDITNLAGQQEASRNLFKFNQLRHAEDQKGYDQDMLAMRKYYSELEKSAKDIETNKLKIAQESSDSLFRINQLRQQQDQDGYKQSMSEMRKYYSDLEKQSKQSITTQPVQMDAAVEAYRKNQAKVADDAAKANAYLAKEMERVNRLNAEGNSIGSATNNRLIKFEQALKASGDSAEQQAAKLAIYRKELLATQKAAGDRQVDYLSRALGPQITDIFVGLATGQAPLTILLQQGGQLRDQFALAGVAGADMGKMLVQAAGSMISSVKDVGMAVGQVFVTAIAGAGKYVTNFGMQITGANVALDVLRAKIIATDGASSAAIATFDKLGKAITFATGAGIFAAIALLVGLVVEYSKVTAAEKELTASLAMSGAALGMSTESAIAYAASMNEVGIGTLDAMRMISEFANTSTDASIPLEEIIKSAKDMQKYVGIASKDTMKAFADISEKPVEGLIKLAKTTGNVTAETILQAEAAVKAGNNAEAARIAQEALSNSNAEVVKRMKNNLDPLQTLWIDIKSGISKAGEALYDFLKSSTMVAIFRTAWETVAVIVAEVWYVLKATGAEISGIASQIRAVMSGDFSGAAQIGEDMKANAKIARDEQDKLVASIMNRNNAEKETLTITEEQRIINRKAAKDIEDRLKNQKAASFNLPEDTNLKKLENDYKNSIKNIDSESSKLINESKVKYALGITDLGDFLSEEISLIVNQNNQKITANQNYIKDLDSAQKTQEASIKKAISIAKSHVKSKDDIEALDKKQIETLKSLKESYDRLTDSAKSQIEVLKDKTIEQQVKALEQLGQYTKKAVDGSQEFVRTQEDIIAKRQLQISLDKQLSGLYGAEAERVKAQIVMEQSHIDKLSELESAAFKAALAFSKIKLSGLAENDPNYKLAQDAVTKAQLSVDTARTASKTAIAKAGIDAEVAYYKQEYERISSGITDAVVTALFEGGKIGRKKLRDLIVAELKKPITIVVKAVVDATLGSLIQSFVGGSSGSSGSGGSSALSTAGNLSSLYNTGSAAFKVGAQYAAGTMSAANAGGTLFANATGTGIEGLLATNGAYGTAAGTTASASQMAMTAGPYVIAAIVALNALGVFRSTKTVGGGITGTLGAGDLQSYALTRESGTLFNGPDYAIANQKILKESEAIQQSYSLLRNNTVAMAEALGLATSDIENYVSRFGSDLIHPDTGGYGIDLTGLSPEQVQIKINENLIQATNEMASIVMGTWERVYAAAAGEDLAGQLAPESLRDVTVSIRGGNQSLTEARWTPNQFVRDGEKAIDALTRLSTSLYAANTSMRHFGITLYDNSLAGADAASSFIDLLGGLEKFNESIGFFYENFFSEEEKIVNKTKDLTKEFAKIGEVLPSTREEFKALVLAAKSIGNDSQVKNLLSLQYAFADLVPATEAVATAVDELTGSSMNYARSLIEANRISQGGGAYTESDFMMKYFVPTYESSAITPIDSSLMTSNITYGSANQSLVDAITLVKEEISELRYEVQADVIQNSKTATILTRVVPDGQSLNVTATVDGGVV